MDEDSEYDRAMSEFDEWAGAEKHQPGANELTFDLRFATRAAAGLLGTVVLVTAVTYIWEKFQYEQILVYKEGVVTVEIVKIRNGKVLIFSDEGVVVQITEPKEMIDLAEVSKIAVQFGAEAAQRALQNLGVGATVERPTDARTNRALKTIASSRRR